MATINPHTTRATGTVLTAAIYNTDHQNHITNCNNLNAELSTVSGVGAASGLVASNGAGTIYGRSILGTGNQIDVANADGLTGSPTLSIPVDFRLPGTLYVTSGITETLNGVIEVPANGDYMIGLKMPFGGKITESVTRDVSGTCTATFKINGVAVDGSANAVSSAEVGVAHAASNVWAAGDDLTITISANSAAFRMSWTIKFLRIGAL